MDFADAGSSPYTAAQVATNAYSIILTTGLFPEACRDWRPRAAADKTWAMFKADFAEAHQDLHLAQGTAQEGGYHGTNNTMDSFINETAGAFANLATVDLTATNKELIQQLATKDAEIATLQASCRSNNNTNTRPNDCTQNEGRRRYNNTNYCWTHGYDCAKNHTSQNCRFPNDGHKREATRDNILNGSVANKIKVM
jgi:hypothetical protein